MKTRIPLDRARETADGIVRLLSPACERIAVAGSVRRGEPEVGDIELVAIPKEVREPDLFGNAARPRSLLDEALAGTGWKTAKNGPRFKQFLLPGNLSLDLFVVLPPAQWGVILAIRTGPREFSRWAVTRHERGGPLPPGCRVQGGAVRCSGVLQETPEEVDFLNLLGIGWVDPAERGLGPWRASGPEGSLRHERVVRRTSVGKFKAGDIVYSRSDPWLQGRVMAVNGRGDLFVRWYRSGEHAASRETPVHLLTAEEAKRARSERESAP